MTTKQRRRAAKHLKRLQGWINISIRKFRKYERKVYGRNMLYNGYAVWRSVSKHLRNSIMRFKYEDALKEWKQ